MSRSASQARAWADPEIRARRVDGQKRGWQKNAKRRDVAAEVMRRLIEKRKQQMPAVHPDSKPIAERKRKLIERPCLNCRRPFKSHGPHNRLCNDCRKINTSPFEP